MHTMKYMIQHKNFGIKFSHRGNDVPLVYVDGAKLYEENRCNCSERPARGLCCATDYYKLIAHWHKDDIVDLVEEWITSVRKRCLEMVYTTPGLHKEAADAERSCGIVETVTKCLLMEKNLPPLRFVALLIPAVKLHVYHIHPVALCPPSPATHRYTPRPSSVCRPTTRSYTPMNGWCLWPSTTPDTFT